MFERAYQALLRDKAATIAPTELNLDGTQSSAKKGGPLWPTKPAKGRVLARVFT